jgi:hypothetical protein
VSKDDLFQSNTIQGKEEVYKDLEKKKLHELKCKKKKNSCKESNKNPIGKKYKKKTILKSYT